MSEQKSVLRLTITHERIGSVTWEFPQELKDDLEKARNAGSPIETVEQFVRAMEYDLGPYIRRFFTILTVAVVSQHSIIEILKLLHNALERTLLDSREIVKRNVQASPKDQDPTAH